MPSGVISEFLQTDTKVKIIDEHLNEWEDFAGSDIVGDSVYWEPPTTTGDYSINHWSYRGQASMCSPDVAMSLSLDGVDDYVTFGDNYDFAATAAHGIVLWIMWDGGAGTIFSKRSASGGNGYEAKVDAAGVLTWVRSDGTTTHTATHATPLVSFVWTLVGFHYATTPTIYIDINGVAGATTASSVSLPGNAVNLTFGRDAYGSSGYLSAEIWGVNVWSKTLSAPERASLYNPAWASAKSYEDAAAAISSRSSYWRMTQATGLMLDSVGAITGTVNGTPDRHLVNGPFDTHSIIRVRVGDGTFSNKNIYIQTITDPTVTTQWTTWTSLYTGTWYAVALYTDQSIAAGYRLVHTGASAIFVDNVSKLGISNVIALNPVLHKPGALFYTVLSQNGFDNRRSMKVFHTTDIVGAVSATTSPIDYEWAHLELTAMADAGSVNLIYALPYLANQPRSLIDSDALVYHYEDPVTYPTDISQIHVLRGASGRAGIRQFHDLILTDLMYNVEHCNYLFYTEDHRDTVTTGTLANLARPLYWQRSMLAQSGWTAPTPTGYSVWGFAGAVLCNGYLYVAGNGRVLRRPAVATEIDLSNYVVSGSLNVPRDNGKATGTLNLANPEGIVSSLLGMSANDLSSAPEKRIDIQLGQKNPDDSDYTYSRSNDWWIAQVNTSKDTVKDRIVIKVEDFWHRLENKFRDIYYFPGHVTTDDWQPGGPNTLLNYVSLTGTMSVVSEVVSGDQSAYLLVNAGAVMYTPWKGGWFDSFSADFDLGSTHVATDLIFRYKDARNYFRVRYLTSTIYLQEVVRGKVNTLQSAAAGSTSALGFNLKVTVHFDRIGVYFNSSLKFTYTRSSDPFRRFFGHCGVWARTASGTSYKIRNLSFSDLEADVSSSRLLHMALGYAGYLLAIISPDLSDAMQLDTMWGPQTDNEDPLTALKKIIETNELQVLAKWPFDASPTIHVDQFTGFETGTTIDDEIISYENVETSLIRPNIVMVDGNEHSWTEYYRPDLLVRDMAVVQYLDLPSLKTQGDVTNRANEELGKGLRSVSPGGTVIWRPTYQRLDNVLWVDQFGETWSMRIEGLEIDFDQGMSPFQRVKIDGGPLSICDDTTEPGTPPAPIVYLASDTFNSRSVTSGWGTAELGGAWTVSGTATQWNVSALAGLLSPTPSSTMLVARLASISGPSLTLQTDIWREKTTVQGNQNFGLMARWIDASNYLLIMVVSKPASTSLIVQQVLAGVRSTVATYALGWGIMQILDTATIQAQVSGNSPVLINCKAWKSRTDPEPSEFQLITNVPGSWATTGPVGLAGNLDPSTINAPVIMHFDNFKVW